MNAGRSLQSLAAELERQVEVRKDYIASQEKIEAVPVDGDIELQGFNSNSYVPTNYAHRQLADVLGVPFKYYERMRTEQPALLANNVNVWLKDQPADKRMIRTVDGRARAILSPKYRPLDNFELAQAVLPKLIKLGVQVVSSELTETRMYIKGILPGLSDALPDGMTWGNGHNAIAEYGKNQAGRVVAAIVIANSEVGNGTLRIEPSVFTTWCTNLAIMKAASMKKYHVGRANDVDSHNEIYRDATREADDRAFFMKVADITDAAFNPEIFRAGVAEIRAAAGQPIVSKELPAVVDVTVARLALPPSSSGSILTYLAQGGDFSKWGLSSAITAAANDLPDYEASTAFERAGGELLAMPARDWHAIANAVAA